MTASTDGAGSGGGNEKSWWTIDGETTGERVRDGLPQLAIISVAVWLGTTVSYNVLVTAFDPVTATASVVLAALYVGLRLRRWLTGGASDGGDVGDTSARGESGEKGTPDQAESSDDSS